MLEHVIELVLPLLSLTIFFFIDILQIRRGNVEV